MTHTLKFAHWIARFRAPVVTSLILALLGCNNTDAFTPDPSTPPADATDEDVPGIMQLDDDYLTAIRFRGGIPFGTYALPTGSFGAQFNGALTNKWPDVLVSELRRIKDRGGKVVLMFAGSELHYKDRRGHFSLTKWKARVDRFKHVNFSSFVKDGTIIGHYLIDEPQDAHNWHGRPIPQATVEEMARYSKRLWPGMVTIVRAEPTWLRKWRGQYRALDASWAQYRARRGSAQAYIQRNVADARAKGLALIAGLNLLHGGVPNNTPMSAAEVERFGSALLSSTYPCAFISWKYNTSLLSRPGMRTAMQKLANRAANRGTKSCRS